MVELLTCLVVAIADGDTLTARCDMQGEQQNLVVRLSQIDAPEKRQPWGDRSRQHLAALCFNKPATVREETRDRNRRMVARVNCDGTDANAEQVREGLAWVFDRYVTDRSLYAVQDDARAARRGLWSDPDPMPPWEWRKR
ncbi:MAG: thermonuclease family protein [Burkholderiales bacterium]|nr:thermonuclease family protein [Burkholderiales bacterium]